MKRTCEACGYEAENLWWDVEANVHYCWHTERCEQRIAERNEEQERLRNQGAIQ